MSLTKQQKQELDEILDRTNMHKGEVKTIPDDYRAFSEKVIREEKMLEFPSLAPVRVIFNTAKELAPGCIVYVNYHGGGFIHKQDAMDDLYCARIAAEIHGIVVDIDYAVSTEYPFPMGFDQSYAVTRMVFEKCAEWGGDPQKIVIGGQSAGGCLAAAISLKAGMTGDFKPALQILQYAANDNYTVTTTGEVKDERSAAFSVYYCDGDLAKLKDPFASPAWATVGEMRNQPRTFIAAPDLCPFYEVNLKFGMNLVASGTEVTFHPYKGSRHGFDVQLCDAWRQAQNDIIRAIQSVAL